MPAGVLRALQWEEQEEKEILLDNGTAHHCKPMTVTVQVRRGAASLLHVISHRLFLGSLLALWLG